MKNHRLLVGATLAIIGLATGAARAADPDIVSTTGGIVVLGATLPSGVISHNWLVLSHSGLTEVAFDEAQDYKLTSSLAVDAGSGPIASGVTVDSALVFFNSKTLTSKASSVTFATKVLGVEYLENKAGFSPSLIDTDFLGRPGETYNLNCFHCGFESSTHDTATISGNTVDFKTVYQQDGDYARVILAAAGVPEPATWAMMLAGFGGVGAMIRSRRKALAAPAA